MGTPLVKIGDVIEDVRPRGYPLDATDRIFGDVVGTDGMFFQVKWDACVRKGLSLGGHTLSYAYLFLLDGSFRIVTDEAVKARRRCN